MWSGGGLADCGDGGVGEMAGAERPAEAEGARRARAEERELGRAGLEEGDDQGESEDGHGLCPVG